MRHFENAKSYLNMFESKKYNSLICWVSTRKGRVCSLSDPSFAFVEGDVLNSWLWLSEQIGTCRCRKRGQRAAKNSTCSLQCRPESLESSNTFLSSHGSSINPAMSQLSDLAHPLALMRIGDRNFILQTQAIQ